VNPTLTLGRIAGIRIGINWSWLIVFALIVWTLGASVFPAQDPHLGSATYAAMVVAAAFLFFASLLLHELGHALQAKREGVAIDGITLWLFGGVASFKGRFPSAGAELRIALAGPAVSAALGGLFVGVAAAIHHPVAIDGVAAWLGYINLLLLAFNMLPALPLDGGRVFRSLLWRWKGNFASATRLAAHVGRGFAYAMIALGLLMLLAVGSWSGAWLALLGWFLLQAAGMEARSHRTALDPTPRGRYFLAARPPAATRSRKANTSRAHQAMLSVSCCHLSTSHISSASLGRFLFWLRLNDAPVRWSEQLAHFVLAEQANDGELSSPG
jgi:Zn-dependent protease